MIYKPPVSNDIPEEDKKALLVKRIKKVLSENPELLNEVLSELRKDKLEKIKNKL